MRGLCADGREQLLSEGKHAATVDGDRNSLLNRPSIAKRFLFSRSTDVLLSLGASSVIVCNRSRRVEILSEGEFVTRVDKGRSSLLNRPSTANFFPFSRSIDTILFCGASSVIGCNGLQNPFVIERRLAREDLGGEETRREADLPVSKAGDRFRARVDTGCFPVEVVARLASGSLREDGTEEIDRTERTGGTNRAEAVLGVVFTGVVVGAFLGSLALARVRKAGDPDDATGEALFGVELHNKPGQGLLLVRDRLARTIPPAGAMYPSPCCSQGSKLPGDSCRATIVFERARKAGLGVECLDATVLDPIVRLETLESGGRVVSAFFFGVPGLEGAFSTGFACWGCCVFRVCRVGGIVPRSLLATIRLPAHNNQMQDPPVWRETVFGGRHVRKYLGHDGITRCARAGQLLSCRWLTGLRKAGDM